MATTPITKSTDWTSLLRDTTGALVDVGTGVRIGPPTPADLWLNAPARNDMDPSRWFEYFDDFLNQASATTSATNLWTAMNDGATGTPAYQGTSGGWFNTVTAAAADDYAGYRSVNKVIDLTAGKQAFFEMAYKLSEAATNESAYWMGICDTTTTGGFQAGSGGPLASFDGALIYKPAGALTINAIVSNGATQASTLAFGTAISNTAHRAGWYYDGGTRIYPFFNNGSAWVAGASIQFSLTSFDAAYLMWGVKAGASGGAETLQADYIKCVVER